MDQSRTMTKPGPLQRLWLLVEKLVNGLTTSAYNPFYYLGAISIFFLWIILVTGVYLFMFYDISARGAYNSVQSLSIGQWYLGGVMRSLHRYASDGIIITMLLHAARTFTLDRYKHWRWIAWVSGVATAWVIWIGGIFGYWMVWDERAKLIANLSARMLESLPIFGIPLSLNFVRPESLTDQLFYIVLFIHFSTAFVLFLLIMIHITRITKSIINPPRLVGYGIIFALLSLAVISPARSGAPAALGHLTHTVPFDWFYLWVFPPLKYFSERSLWIGIVFATVMVSIVPWLTRVKRKPAVAVELPNCTGCELCMEDCPYQAIQMRARTDGMPYQLEAVVDAKRCASCGICVGSCDYKALNLPDITEQSVKTQIKAFVEELKDAPGPKVMVFACAKGAWVDGRLDDKGRLAGYEWARVVSLPCIGMLQPSMLSIPFAKGLDGVYVASCTQGDCHYRRGNEWFAGRLAGFRPPVITKAVDRDRLKTVYLSAIERDGFLAGLDEFKRTLEARPGAAARKES